MPAIDSRAATFRHLAFLLTFVWLGALLYFGVRQVFGVLTERGFSPDLWQPVHYITL